jgi:hypothetical protein
MKKKTPYLDFYFKCLETGHIPYRETETVAGGLCSIFEKDKFFQLFSYGMEVVYWGISDNQNERYTYSGDFETDLTPIRENVILLMAAMNNEL